MKLRTQFLAYLLAATFLSVGLSAGGFWYFEGRYLQAASAGQAELIADSAEKAARDALLQGDPAALVSYLRFLKRQRPELAFVRVSWPEGESRREVLVGDEIDGARHLERDFPPPSGRGEVRLEAGLDWAVADRALAEAEARLKRQTLAVLALLCCVGAALTALWSWRLAKPLKALSDGAEAIGRGRLGLRLEVPGEDELGQLVKAFNRMSERLDELDKMKKDFVSAVTHDLRSPLAAVESLLNALASGEHSPEDSREYLTRARGNLQRLGGLIDNLLDAAKIERGQMDYHPAHLDLEEAVDDVLALFELRAGERGVALAKELSAREAVVDPEAFRRVLVNLVSNALKFTPSGGSIRVGARPAGKGWVEVFVADTGKGISPADQERLFQKFVRGRERGKASGTGLGLYLVKQVAEAHGGRVALQSRPGEGATFTLTLPSA